MTKKKTLKTLKFKKKIFFFRNKAMSERIASLSMFACLLLVSGSLALLTWGTWRFGFQAFRGLDDYITSNPKCDNEAFKNTSSGVRGFSKYRCDNFHCNKIYSDYVRNTFDEQCNTTRKSAGIVWDRDKIVDVLSCVEISVEFNFSSRLVNFDDCYSIDNTYVFFNYLWPTVYFFVVFSCITFCCSLVMLAHFFVETWKRYLKRSKLEGDS